MNRYATSLKGILFTAAIFAAFINRASGADLAPLTAAPEATTASTQSPWQVRLRALGVITNDSGSVDGLPGSDLSYSNTVVPEIDISYFFTDNIALELILGTTYAKVHGEGTASGFGEIGKTWFLPPTLTLQYHFTDFGRFKPYVGAGVNYSIFYNQSGNSVDDLDVKNAFGVALQAGFDYMIDNHWGFNVDVKKIFLRPDWEVHAGGTKLEGDTKLDPWLIGAGVTYRF
ncbi:outer membrane protein [Rhizobium mesoamericanum]|uniref:OmpW/AlkL family protein n=1 Tax=Rhizobium mesoamericanum TaxID=1079800 RepID=UPI002784DC34|nr:OmpW family protein [Rhizobium mesoamericanum]MDQ0559389.1 outer membrane protein [Rhizobium mesoamericanum]